MNGFTSLKRAYEALSKIASIAKPEQYPEIVNLFKIAKDSDRNNASSLGDGKECFKEALESMAQKNPKYALSSSNQNAAKSQNILNIFEQQKER